nr:hypothetical protein [Tanacetum cinerariifolium]
MSGSEPGEMAPESSRAMVVPKFNMHIYTSELTSTELKDAINEYCILNDLHPRLPHPVISMDTFLKLPTWTGTIVSKCDPLPKDHRPKPQAKRAGTGATEGLKKKRRVQKNVEPTRSGSKDTLSASPLNQAIPETVPNPTIVASEVPPQVEKELVDLSGNTRVSFPPVIDVPPSPRQEHHDTHEIHSQSSYHGSEDEPVGNRYVPNWMLRNDLRVCTFSACKELVSHLATLMEDEFLGVLSNVKVISRAYQTLRQYVVAQGELLKSHEQLNHDCANLRNRNDAHLLELDHLRSSVRRIEQENEGLGEGQGRVTASNQVEQIRALEKDIEPKTYQLEEERIRVLEGRLWLFRLACAIPLGGWEELAWVDVPAPGPTAEVPDSTREQAGDTDPRFHLLITRLPRIPPLEPPPDEIVSF